MNDEEIKLFAMSHQMLESELDKVEDRFKLDLCRDNEQETTKDEQYYPQFGEAIRAEAASMAKHYEIFYCLEKSIRDLIRGKLSAEKGTDWWNQGVPVTVKNNVEGNIKRELDSGVTQRSTEKIDYTTFGELGEIVRSNWQIFSDTFNSQKAFDKIMTSLNILRGPIAHCCPLAEDEVAR